MPFQFSFFSKITLSKQVLISFVVVAIAVVYCPQGFCIKPLHLLAVSGDPFDWIFAALPLFLLGVVHTLFVLVKNRENEALYVYPKKILVDGLFDSWYHGVSEEVVYRWLFVLSGIIFLKLLDFLFFGWLGFGFLKWIFSDLILPAANALTLGSLSSVFFHSAGWYIGAVALISSALFAEGHRYLGILGYANSWIGSLYFFWILFSFGLPIAIMVHILYDAMVHVIIYRYVVRWSPFAKAKQT